MSLPSFAFLALKEHPYACEMLRQLLSAGHVPAMMIEEDSGIADEERGKFLERIEGHALAPSMAEQAREHGIAVHTLGVHKSEAILDVIGGRELDLIVLGGTRIIRGPVLSYAKHGVINTHPGLLPDCRGSASPAWSVYHDIPVGSTTHFCDEGIDTGDLLLRREVAVTRGMTYEDLCYETLMLSGQLAKEALCAFDEGRWAELRHPQGEAAWPTFKNAPEEILAAVRAKLAAQTYKHYVDSSTA
ncbi:MAG: methionyl-tRNA formyltransferase [Planctomycetota bacterium]|jgi:methionyl-tRNA formyltransferase